MSTGWLVNGVDIDNLLHTDSGDSISDYIIHNEGNSISGHLKSTTIDLEDKFAHRSLVSGGSNSGNMGIRFRVATGSVPQDRDIGSMGIVKGSVPVPPTATGGTYVYPSASASHTGSTAGFTPAYNDRPTNNFSYSGFSSRFSGTVTHYSNNALWLSRDEPVRGYNGSFNTSTGDYSIQFKLDANVGVGTYNGVFRVWCYAHNTAGQSNGRAIDINVTLTVTQGAVPTLLGGSTVTSTDSTSGVAGTQLVLSTSSMWDGRYSGETAIVMEAQWYTTSHNTSITRGYVSSTSPTGTISQTHTLPSSATAGTYSGNTYIRTHATNKYGESVPATWAYSTTFTLTAPPALAPSPKSGNSGNSGSHSVVAYSNDVRSGDIGTKTKVVTLASYFNDNGYPILEYRIEAGVNSTTNSSFSAISSVISNTTLTFSVYSSQNYSGTTITNYHNRYARVSARNANGWGGWTKFRQSISATYYFDSP